MATWSYDDRTSSRSVVLTLDAKGVGYVLGPIFSFLNKRGPSPEELLYLVPNTVGRPSMYYQSHSLFRTPRP